MSSTVPAVAAVARTQTMEKKNKQLREHHKLLEG